MKHEMELYTEPFDSIKSGRKTIEVRLYDEKRRKLSIGDSIIFTKVPDNDETLIVKITGLTIYPTFKEMYESIPASDFDVVGESIEEMVESTYEIYTPKNEKEWGTLAIKIKLIDKE